MDIRIAVRVGGDRGAAAAAPSPPANRQPGPPSPAPAPSHRHPGLVVAAGRQEPATGACGAGRPGGGTRSARSGAATQRSPRSLPHLQGKYRLGRKIGSGSFGDIYIGAQVN